MLRKLLCLTLVILFSFSAIASAQVVTADTTVLGKTVAVEKALYGSEQTGSLFERVNKLEKDIYGVTTKEALVNKLDRIYSYIKETSAGQASFVTKLDAVEWTLTHAVTTHPAKSRMENLERVILGDVVAGSFDDRLSKLMRLAFSDGQIDVSGTTLAKDALIKIKMVSSLDSRTSRAGDNVAFEVLEDVYVGPILVIAKGAQGVGQVNKVEQARNFGRDAKLEIAFESVQALDGSTVSTLLGDKAKEETKSLATAAGASVAGIAILGPIGIVGGAFVHGQEITIPSGAQLYIQVKNETNLYGIKVK